MSRLICIMAFVAMVALVPLVSADKLLSVIPCTRGNYGTAKLDEIRITPCPEAANRRPCILKKGTNVSIEVDFKPTIDSGDKVTGRAFWASRVLELPLPNMNTDACESISCPLQANSAQTYRYVLNVSRGFPNRRYDVKWKLSDSKSFNVCFQFPIQIVN